MTNGHLIASRCSGSNPAQLFLITLLCVASLCFSTEARAHSELNSGLNCDTLPVGSVKHRFTLESSLPSNGVSPCELNPSGEIIQLICSVAPSNCVLLLSTACGLNPSSGFYRCSSYETDSVSSSGVTYHLKFNYSYIDSLFYKDEELKGTLDFDFVESNLVTYQIAGFSSNLSRCESSSCYTDWGIFANGDYFLTTLPASCPCEGFNCCNSQKRSIQACTYSMNTISCDPGNCTVIHVNGTLESLPCQTWSWIDIRMVCVGSLCYPSPIQPLSSATPSILSPAAFWSLLALSIVLFLALGALVVFVLQITCCSRPGLM